MMQSFLTEQQVVDYKKKHKESKGKRDADRIKAILLLNKGYDYVQTAEILLMDEDSIRRWHNEYEAGGIEYLLQDRYKGGETKLSMEQRQELTAHLDEQICLTSKEVCQYVKERYCVEYTAKGMTDLLHRLGFVYKKPKHLPSKADRVAQEEFIIRYKELKQNKKAEDKIYFVDGTHPMHNSQLGYGWIKKGKEKFVKANTGRARVNLNGAYNVEENKIIVREDESINAQSTVALLEQMQKQQPEGMLYVILDNARYYHSKHVKEFLKKNTRIKFVYLPPYSPNLNLIERLWKLMKKKVAYNKYYEKFFVFRENIMLFFQNLNKYQQELKNLMTENFQLFPA